MTSFPTRDGRRRRAHHTRPLHRVGVAVVLAVAALFLTACSGGTADGPPVPGAGRTHPHAGSTAPSPGTSPAAPPAGSPAASSTSSGSSTATHAAPTSPVHVSLYNADGAHYGVGMPVIAYFSQRITDAAPLQRATTVTVDGRPAHGAWYFETSDAGHGPVEGHLRLRGFWPAHAHVRVGLPVDGLSAGSGLTYDDSLTLDFTTGARTIGVVDDRDHTLTLTSDGRLWGHFPVSLGAPGTPTLRGTKVVMEKQYDTAMRGPGYYDPDVYWTERLTYGGEYLHAAPWNEPPNGNIGRSDSSNGCTNLTTADARRIYGLLEVGDVVRYPDASGPRMALGQGFGDWNIPWSQWTRGGLVITT